MLEVVPNQVLELVAMHEVLAVRIQNLPQIKKIINESQMLQKTQRLHRVKNKNKSPSDLIIEKQKSRKNNTIKKVTFCLTKKP